MTTRFSLNFKRQVDLGLIDPEESKQPRKKPKKKRTKTRLTEDLLYIVNKKLRSSDKARRDQIIEDIIIQPVNEESRPFSKVLNRRRTPLDFNQTELAVMHVANFNSSYIAVCEHNTMDTFVRSVQLAARRTYSRYYSRLLGSIPGYHKDYNDGIEYGKHVKNVVGFVQLPKDYFSQYSESLLETGGHFFGELAWKEDDVIMVEADKFALCMNIWKLKQWLVLPGYNQYPLSCEIISQQFPCRCKGIIRAMWTDRTIRMFFEDQGIAEYTHWYLGDYESYRGQLLPLAGRIEVRDYRSGLQRARDEMKNFCKKLITGEEMISDTNKSMNVLFSLQLQRILKKLDAALNNCESEYHSQFF